MPAVSVIIPVYNVEKYLRECLDSVLAQTFPDLEIICVNDGSTDGSRTVLSEYVAKDDRIRIVDRENGGLSEARNSGASVATGKYIYFLDSDDWLEPNAMQKCFEISEKHHLDVFIFDCKAEFESEDLHDCFAFKPSDTPYEEIALTGPELFEKQYKNHDYLVCTWLRFIRREYYVAKKLSFYPHLIHEDELFAFYCDLLAECSMYQHWMLYHYRIRANSIVTKPPSFARFEAMAIIIREGKRFLAEHPDVYERCKHTINDRLIDQVHCAELIRSKISTGEYTDKISNNKEAQFLAFQIDYQVANDVRFKANQSAWQTIYQEAEFRAERAEGLYANLLNTKGMRFIRFIKKQFGRWRK